MPARPFGTALKAGSLGLMPEPERRNPDVYCLQLDKFPYILYILFVLK